MNSLTITVVGLALTAFCVLIALRPVWFRNWRVVHRDSDGWSHGSSRLGDSPRGTVSAFYALLAVVLLVCTLALRGFAVSDELCGRARAVHEAGTDEDSWAAAAEADDLVLLGEQDSSDSGRRWTSYALSTSSGRLVATWSAGSDLGDRFECSR